MSEFKHNLFHVRGENLFDKNLLKYRAFSDSHLIFVKMFCNSCYSFLTWLDFKGRSIALIF